MTILEWQIDSPPRIEEALRQELEQLWEEDCQASPFVSPRFLALLYRRSLGAGHRPLLILGRREDGSLAAVWPLRRVAGSRIEFLGGGVGDHYSCLAAHDVGAAELGRGLVLVLSDPDCASFAFVDVPNWGITLEAIRVAVARVGWKARIFAASACPEIAVEPGPELGERFAAEINRHRRVRSYANKLQRREGFVFEVLEGDEDLEGWARDYCDAHEWRWDATPTPSLFRFREERELFVEDLRSWIDDGTLVRFSVRLGDQRVALVGAVCANGRLVYHRVAASPAAHESRAGMILIRLIGLWMAERGFWVLDFGVGAEEYKLRFSNGDPKLWRATASRRRWSRLSLRGVIEERIRASETLQVAWDEWANRRIRGDLLHFLTRLRFRLQLIRRVHRTAPRELLQALITRTTGRQEEVCYRARAEAGDSNVEIMELHPFDALEMLEAEQGALPSLRAERFAAVHHGSRAYGIVELGKVIHVSWLSRIADSELPELFDAEGGAVWCIRDMVTARSARGRGIHLRVLRALLRVIPERDWATISCQVGDRDSNRGFVEAGFEPFALCKSLRGRGPEFTPYLGSQCPP